MGYDFFFTVNVTNESICYSNVQFRKTLHLCHTGLTATLTSSSISQSLTFFRSKYYFLSFCKISILENLILSPKSVWVDNWTNSNSKSNCIYLHVDMRLCKYIFWELSKTIKRNDEKKSASYRLYKRILLMNSKISSKDLTIII